MKKLFTLVVCAMLCIAATAQSTITGKIIDSDTQPLIGASVVERGTTNGTITDINGDFSLIASSNAVLEVSYVGFDNQTVSLNGQTSVEIMMSEGLQIGEILVTGSRS